jgi:hypothetical protein
MQDQFQSKEQLREEMRGVMEVVENHQEEIKRTQDGVERLKEVVRGKADLE